MIVIEMSEDKFGKAMKDIACIEDKLEGIKGIFEEEASGVSYRNKRYLNDDYDREYPRERKPYGGRYM